MKQAVLAAVTAALIAGTAVTYAANPGDTREGGRRWQPTAEDVAILADARIAALKTGLKLTPEQEKLWPAVETALRDAAKDRAQRMAQARAAREQAGDQRPDPITRMRSTADRMTAASTDLRKIADAAEPLYKTLDDGQKARLNVLIRQNMRAMGPHGGKGPRWGMGPGGPDGARPGMMQRGDLGPHDGGPRGGHQGGQHNMGPRLGMLPGDGPDARFAMGPFQGGGADADFGPAMDLGADLPAEPGMVPLDFL